MSLTLVLASFVIDFENWCRETGVSPRDPSVKYVRDIQDLRGLGRTFDIVVADGRFWDRRDAAELYATARRLQDRYRDLGV
jgi:hypothetical protein